LFHLNEVNRFRDTVTITVPLPADEAMALFTARGERRWVEGWDPEFPAGEPSEEGEGTVFVTTADGRLTYWVVVAREADRIRYGRTTPGFAAGTVEVRRRLSDAGSTQVDVTYEEDIGAWEVAIESASGSERLTVRQQEVAR
jgi:hypothetical protein